MKNFKLLLASLLFVIAGALSATAQTTKIYNYTGTTSSHPNFLFVVPGGSNTSFLNLTGNYAEVFSSEPNCPNPEQTFCAFKAEVSAGITLPGLSDLISAIKTKLDDLLDDTTPTTFSNNYQFFPSIGGVTVTITIFTKQNAD